MKDKTIFNLLIIAYYYPNLKVDEYFYHMFDTNNLPMFERMKEAFPMDEIACDSIEFNYEIGEWETDCFFNYIKGE